MESIQIKINIIFYLFLFSSCANYIETARRLANIKSFKLKANSKDNISLTYNRIRDNLVNILCNDRVYSIYRLMMQYHRVIFVI